MYELNNEKVHEFVQDLPRGKTFFRFANFTKTTNNAIGHLIINMALAMRTYGVQIDDELANESSSSEKARPAQRDSLSPSNRLIVSLLNYFWYLSNNAPRVKFDQKIIDMMVASERVTAKREKIDVAYNQKIKKAKQEKDKEKIKYEQVIHNLYQEMKDSITCITDFVNKLVLPMAPELTYFLNQYNQSITNPFAPEAVLLFREYDASLALEKTKHRIKVLMFSPSTREITVKNICAGITVNLVHDDLNNIEMKLPATALMFSSKMTFKFLDVEKKAQKNEFIESVVEAEFSTEYRHSGALLDLFQQCQRSSQNMAASQNTAAFLAILLTVYRNKEQNFEGYEQTFIDNTIQSLTSSLIGWSEGNFDRYQGLTQSLLKQLNEPSIKILPYTVGPICGLIVLGGLGVIGFFFFPPAGGAIIVGTGLLGGLLGVGGALSISKLEEWQENRHHKNIMLSQVISDYGQFVVETQDLPLGKSGSSINHDEGVSDFHPCPE